MMTATAQYWSKYHTLSEYRVSGVLDPEVEQGCTVCHLPSTHLTEHCPGTPVITSTTLDDGLFYAVVHGNLKFANGAWTYGPETQGTVQPADLPGSTQAFYIGNVNGPFEEGTLEAAKEAAEAGIKVVAYYKGESPVIQEVTPKDGLNIHHARIANEVSERL